MFKNIITRRLLLSAVVLATPVVGVFANTEETVSQVTEAVTLAEGMDYHISNSTPFASGGSITLAKGGTSVVILDNVKPSNAVSLLGTYVLIGGEKAVRGTNCDIRIHAQGTIIYPYTEKDAPLTVYSEQNYGGTAVSDFGLEDDGGFMNTLTDARLNNKIRSFKLRRGFMVTFSTRAGGYGYSRCFIAADEDLNMATLPAILDRSITSYRIFKWNDNSKKGLANNTNVSDNTKLRTTSAYSFGNGQDMGLDFECVRHHIHEAWPSIASVGANDYTTSNPTVKTNNEPGNSADDNPATVAQVLANWQALMATGKRLCSPSSHDGSLNWLRQFMDSIDARGWRCDVLDMHCYWTEGSFNNLASWYNSYKRPIWVSEWIWGASWNRNGAFGSGVTDSQITNTTMSIVNKMEGWDYVERYFYWNSESKGHLLENGSLTALGQQYSTLDSKVGFKSNMQYVPTIPKSKGAPSNLAVKYDLSTRTAILTWHDPNGEYNSSMVIEYQVPGSSTWQSVEVVPEEDAADYTYTLQDVQRGTKFRIHTVYADGTTNAYAPDATHSVEAVPADISDGDAMDVDGNTMYLGGNIIVNGDFSMGLYGWTAGDGSGLSAPYFQAVAKGGYNDEPFLQAYSTGSSNSASSIYTVFDLEPNATYYFSGIVYFPKGSTFSSLILSGDGLDDKVAVTVPKGEVWTKFGSTFSTDSYTKGTLSFRWLAAQAAYGELSIRRLFGTQAEALADAATQASRRVETEKVHPTFATKDAETAARQDANTKMAMENIGLIGDSSDLSQYTLAQQDDINEPQFAISSTGWSKAGTYTGGSQGRATVGGRTCWSAQWTGVAASEDKAQSMEVRQQLSDLTHGIYLLSVDAAADHYCISDQHGYLVADGDSVVTPVLSLDVMDLPTVDTGNKWQTLTTEPVYYGNGTDAAVGFASSKDGAVDYQYKPYGEPNTTRGDRREGSWYATNFRLLHLPVYKLITDTAHWRGLCMPYAIKASDNLRLFTIAGRDNDGTVIYLNEVDSAAAGQPCVALAADTVQIVVEEGTAVARAGAKVNGLRGYLETSSVSRAAQNSLVLKDGYWQTQTSSTRSEREHLEDYTAIIDKMENVPVLASWQGVALPVDRKSLTPTLIDNVINGRSSAKAVYFDMSGRQVKNPANGVYVRIIGDTIDKVVVK